MVDATKVSKIKINTGYAGEKEYPIFTRMGKNDQVLSDAQCAIILGKNGSGKSTIARALSSENSDVKFFDKDGVFIGSDYSNVYVFDERFIGKNFRMSGEEALALVTQIVERKTIPDILKNGLNQNRRISGFNRKQNRMDEFKKEAKSWRIFRMLDKYFSRPDRTSVSEGAVSEGAVSEGAVSEGAVSEGAVSEGAVSEGAVSEGAVESNIGYTNKNKEGILKWWEGLSEEEQKHISSRLASAKRNFEQKQIKLQMPRIMRDTQKANDNINFLLSIVFGENVISVNYGENGYEIIKENGRIYPSSLSTGEQNIVSLCYFFAQMMDGEKCGSIQEFLAGNRIIILDDPLSSFDFGNKYGVIRLLDYVMNLMSKKESESKLIIMTHDPETAIELSKIAIGRLGGKKVKCCEISNNDEGSLLESVKFDGIDEYKNILGKMYGIAVGKEDTEMPAPNEVRRVWEAFLRFELGVSSVSDRKAIEKVRDYYNKDRLKYEFLDSFMSYAFIHQDSHSASQMLFFNFSLFPVLSDEDFRKHIRQIICFIHIVSPLHIASRLSNDGTEAQKYREELENMYKQIVRKES